MEQCHKHYRASTSAMQKTDAESRLDDLDKNKMLKPPLLRWGRWTVLRGAEYRPQQQQRKALYRRARVYVQGQNLSKNELDSSQTYLAGRDHSSGIVQTYRQLDNVRIVLQY